MNDRDEWRSERNGNHDDRQGRYNTTGRSNYENYDNRSSYNRPQQGNYNRPFSNERSGGYDRNAGGGYNRQGGNSYGRSSGGGGNYNRPPQRGGYDNRPQYSSYNSGDNYGSGSRSMDDGGAPLKKRRPRVGETVAPQGGGGYGQNRPNQGGGRPSFGNRDNRGFQGGNNRGGGNRMQQRRPQGPGQGQGKYNPNAKYSVQKQNKYREENFDPNEPLRLNKYLANAGVCSRREADDFIQAGVVKVNGVVVTELGTKVKRVDQVMFHDQPIKLEHKIYVLLNKPKNCVTTADDPQERLTVMDLVKNACHERIFPVGRLDRNTTGVLLLTNDGDLASKLTHPKFLKKKIYHVWLDKNVTIADMQKIAEGIELEDGEIHADAISYITDEDKSQVGIEIHSGKNRVVRRMFEALGYHVVKLDRVYFAGLTKKNLKRGQWRYLSDKEVSFLRMGAFS